MLLNVPVTITLPPLDRSYTVHTERLRWSTEQLAAVPDGRAHMERAVRRGVREAALSCAYAQFTEADITVTDYPDGSIAMLGRVLCDEAKCYTAARQHHHDAAESIEAQAAAEWAAEKDLGLAPGSLRAEKQRRTGWTFEQRRFLARTLFALIVTAAGVAMSTYDYQRPDGLSGGSMSASIGRQADEMCNFLAFPTITAGALLLLFAVTSAVIARTKES
ncbi:hypothetical protein ACODT4_44375 [Streptomyces sp. 2.9]|uniref:hypothetical protein n=1 Tax=Streptomyces tritrimontium TaxID=3406573 RepID=UPI003BB5E05D